MQEALAAKASSVRFPQKDALTDDLLSSGRAACTWATVGTAGGDGSGRGVRVALSSTELFSDALQVSFRYGKTATATEGVAPVTSKTISHCRDIPVANSVAFADSATSKGASCNPCSSKSLLATSRATGSENDATARSRVADVFKPVTFLAALPRGKQLPSVFNCSGVTTRVQSAARGDSGTFLLVSTHRTNESGEPDGGIEAGTEAALEPEVLLDGTGVDVPLGVSDEEDSLTADGRLEFALPSTASARSEGGVLPLAPGHSKSHMETSDALTSQRTVSGEARNRGVVGGEPTGRAMMPMCAPEVAVDELRTKAQSQTRSGKAD